MTLLAANATPATSVTTTTETLAANVPATPVILPAASPQAIIVRGKVIFTTGASTTGVQVKLRLGQSNTTTNPIDQTEQIQVIASQANEELSFEFYDAAGPANLTSSGYSITVTQVAATGNGTIVSVTYEVDYAIP